MGKKRKSSVASKPWCWYCDREFEDEKVLITHQKAKHFKCVYCYKKLNSASGLVIHVAQIHKETMTTVPNAVEGHDTPELDIFGMSGVPAEDLQRHQEGLPIMPYKRLKVSEGGLLPLLAAQKAGVPDEGGRRGSVARTGPSGAGMGYMPAVGPFSNTTPFSPPLPMTTTATTTPTLPPMPNATLTAAGPTASATSEATTTIPFTGDASPSSTATGPSAAGSAPSPLQPGASSMPLQQPPYHHHPPHPMMMMMMMGRGAPPGPMPYYMYGHHHYPSGTVPPPPPPYYHHPHPAMMGAYPPPAIIMSPAMQMPPPVAEEPAAQTEAPITDQPVESPPVPPVGGREDEEKQDLPSLVYPPSLDPNTGRMLPGGIIVAPHVHKSMEELRANMKQYRCFITATGGRR